MSRILYFIQVPWDWVKQRPHFIAEALAMRHDITVVHNKPYTRFKLVRNTRPGHLNLIELYVIPFAYLSGLNAYLISRQMKKLVADSDIIWLTHPFQFHQIKGALSEDSKVVYDCMDNFLEFKHIKMDKDLSNRVIDIERQLVERSAAVITSSHYLKKMLTRRYSPSREPYVINNALSINKEWAAPAGATEMSLKRPGKTTVTLSYIGTIAPWFDFDLVLDSLAQNDKITYHLYGPCEIPIPQHKRLIYHGPVPHEQLQQIMATSDALVMPFKLNDLVYAVNPVKLYEYIYSHKPAISVQYAETEQFEPFLHLYHTRDDYFRLVNQLADGNLWPKQSQRECLAFAERNTWESRAERVLDILEDIAN
jgi:teichuronic acid biosynthesis glycosyltransferase TuaH